MQRKSKMPSPMDNLDLLSDEELRLRLLQYGFQNLPITQTTRKILVRKLRNAMSSEKTKVRAESSLVTGFSSGDESETDGSRRQQPKRATISAFSTPNKSAYNYTVSGRPSTRTTRTTTRNTYVSPLITAENSDEDESYNGSIGTRQRSRNSSGYGAASDQSGVGSGIGSGIGSGTSYNGPSMFSSNSDRSHESNGYNEIPPYSQDDFNEFKKRLMQLRNDTLSRPNGPPPPIPRRGTLPRDIVTQAEPVPEPTVKPLNVALTNVINKLDEVYAVKQTFVPCMLVSIFICFFVVLAGVYLTISPDILSTLTVDTTHHTICSSNNAMHQATVNCIESDQLEPALQFLRTIAVELQDRAELYHCVDASHSHIMTVRDLVAYFIDTDPNAQVLQVINSLHNAQYLVAQNPHWRIKNVDSSGSVVDFDAVLALRASESNSLAIPDPVLPFKCIFWNKMIKFFYIVGILAIVGFVLYMIRLFYLYVKWLKQARQEKVDNMISEITNAVMEQAAKERNCPGEDGAVVIAHLRDKLLPRNKRKELEWAFNEALNYLEDNESRMLFETGQRYGRDVHLIRWIDASSVTMPSSPSAYSSGLESNRSTVKLWQSRAFDKSNKIVAPPTSCLKIRNMFDKYDTNDPSLKQVIQDAIMAKVGNGCRIYDLQLDKQSCCVYLRCATERDAGHVHDNINGWWFDNHLVSIKFLRLERYLQRFPNSNSGPHCLRPGSLTSLSAPLHAGSNGDDIYD